MITPDGKRKTLKQTKEQVPPHMRVENGGDWPRSSVQEQAEKGTLGDTPKKARPAAKKRAPGKRTAKMRAVEKGAEPASESPKDAKE